MIRNLLFAILLVSAMSLSSACIPTPESSPSPTVTLSQYQLEYRLLEKYPDYFWCDPYLWPIVREGQEEKDSLEQFPVIRANTAEFSAILEHLKLADKTDYTDSEKLAIFREHNKLNRAIQMTSSGNIYDYVIRIIEGQGFAIHGTVTPSGFIHETKRESSINTCPICLVRGTLIGTPNGTIPVEQMKPGLTAWTLDGLGNRVIASVTAASATQVPSPFRVVRISLEDGRSVTASPGHPSATGQALGNYQPGDTLDGAVVTGVKLVDYEGGQTFDILPSGPTGSYWADGILLGSTLKP
jgi:hypothetical protein